jgi:hypothetical protein
MSLIMVNSALLSVGILNDIMLNDNGPYQKFQKSKIKVFQDFRVDMRHLILLKLKFNILRGRRRNFCHIMRFTEQIICYVFLYLY